MKNGKSEKVGEGHMKYLGFAFVILLFTFSSFAQVKDDARPVVDDSKTTPATVRDPKLPDRKSVV